MRSGAWLAEFLGVPQGTIASWVFRGKIPHYRLGDRTVRFDEDEVKRWLGARHVTARVSFETRSAIRTSAEERKAIRAQLRSVPADPVPIHPEPVPVAPRVTARDFEELAVVAESTEAIGARTAARRVRLAVSAPPKPKVERRPKQPKKSAVVTEACRQEFLRCRTCGSLQRPKRAAVHALEVHGARVFHEDLLDHFAVVIDDQSLTSD